MLFGGYTTYRDGEEEQAKEDLRMQLHNCIDSLCEKEDFWIKKEAENGKTIGWKISVPTHKG